MQTIPTDYGVGDVDGKGDSSLALARENIDRRMVQDEKGWNGRKPWSAMITWKAVAVAAAIYYFYSMRK